MQNNLEPKDESKSPAKSGAGYIFGGFIAACYFMLFCFPISLLFGLRDGTPLLQTIVNDVICFFVLWGLCAYIGHGWKKMLEEVNKPRSDDERGGARSDDDGEAKG